MQDNVRNLPLFYLDVYMADFKQKSFIKSNLLNLTTDKFARFDNLCNSAKDHFKKEWENEQGNNSDNTELLLQRQKYAIIGYTAEVNYFKDKIREYLKVNNLLEDWFPSWYESLIDAVFHENWGLAGIAPWKNMVDSSSAKIIGNRIYFLIDGKSVLQDQKISQERLDQLRKALLLKTPKKRLNESYSEVYMQSGERITIFYGDRVKEGQPSIVFRKYVVDKFTFEEQADRHTIPWDIIPMQKAMVKIGFNVAFVGPVRTGKTTYLTTWQSYENPELEGVMVETDPEIPLHKILPNSPIIQLLADGEEFLEIKKELVRSDADYIILGEARDGYALDFAIEQANKGTMRSKFCYHLGFIEDFCYDVANKIITVYGGNLDYHIVKVAKSYQYLFQFIQLSDKSKKRLKGIFEVRYDRGSRTISFHQICKYDHLKDNWSFKYDIGADKKEIAFEEDIAAFNVFDSELKKLSEKYPMEGESVIYPVYSKVGDANEYSCLASGYL